MAALEPLRILPEALAGCGASARRSIHAQIPKVARRFLAKYFATGKAGAVAAWSRMPLSNAQKRDLKARAQKLEPVVKLGHGGMSTPFLQSLDEALSRHELVKLKFSDFKEERKTLTPQIAAATRSEVVMQVGNVAVFFRAKEEPQK